MSDANPKDVVKGMAALVLSSGRLSEFHEKNLKMYPFIFFENVKEARVDYDLAVRHDVEVDKANNIEIKKPLQHCFVAFYLTIEEGGTNDNLQKRFDAIESSVRNLLWNGLPVEVYFNDKIMFKSTKGRTNG